MKHLSLILIILILSCCPLHPAYAFFDKDIRLLTMRDGLADNTIPCIYKDEDGFMWFGTDNGLSRYDGKTIQNFKPANTYVSIAAIVRLSDDFLGIVSDGYLYYFNRKRETFLPIHTESDTAIGVFNVLPADDSSFWGISGNRLILCQWEIQQGKEEEKTAVRVRIQKTFQLLEEKGEVFSSLCYHEKAGSGIWLTTNRGNLILFHPDTPGGVSEDTADRRKNITSHFHLEQRRSCLGFYHRQRHCPLSHEVGAYGPDFVRRDRKRESPFSYRCLSDYIYRQ